MMEEKIAKGISTVFHPIFMPLYGLFLLFSFENFFTYMILLKAKITILSFVAMITVIFPLMIIYMMKQQGFIKSITMEVRSERLIPYIVMTLFYVMTYIMFLEIELPLIFKLFMMGASLLMFLVILLNFVWKISIHMVGIGGITGVLIGFSFNFSVNLMLMIGTLFLISGIIGYARLKLSAHKPHEIYFGFLTGIMTMSLLFALS